MVTRTSKKQMREADEMMRLVFGSSGEGVYARGEYDASWNAYVRHNGELTAYKSNTDAYMAVCKLVCDADI